MRLTFRCSNAKSIQIEGDLLLPVEKVIRGREGGSKGRSGGDESIPALQCIKTLPRFVNLWMESDTSLYVLIKSNSELSSTRTLN